MEKIVINGIEETIYHNKLDNGLEIYMLPNTNKNNIYATYTSRYGGIHNEFIPIGEKDYKKVPVGIAHFLEHKMFEQEDGIDPFSFFSKTGTEANAGTGFDYTSYLFYGPGHLKENLGYLLDFVNSPFFNDENVEKEKGIIEQEIKMYDDSPEWVIQDNLRANIFHKHPLKESIGGTVESVNAITKEDLYTCYNTFYHPSNMILVVTGNFDYNEAFEIIKEDQSKRDYKAGKELKIKLYNEPKEVVKEYEEKEMAVEVPKVSIGIKIPLKPIANIDPKKRGIYFNILIASLFGSTSLFYERMRKDNYITSSIYIDLINSEEYCLLTITAESDKYKQFIEEVKKELININIEAEDVERMKKVLISSTILIYDAVVNINDKIVSNLIHYNKIYPDEIDMIKELNKEDIDMFIKKIDFSKTSTYVIKPLSEIAE
jgi:predicted Zn-dependent peptidase